MADYAFGSNPPYELMGIASLHPRAAAPRFSRRTGRAGHGVPDAERDRRDVWRIR